MRDIYRDNGFYLNEPTNKNYKRNKKRKGKHMYERREMKYKVCFVMVHI